MAYFDTKENSLEEAIRAAVKNEKLDSVNKTAVKKKFDDRKDKDIDNDGDVDSSDKYLHKRRKAISKAVKNEEDKLDENKVSFGGGLPRKPEGYLVTGGEGDNNQKIIGLVKTQKQAEKIRDDYNKKNNPKKPSHRARVYASRSADNDLKVGDDISWSRYSRKENYKKLKEDADVNELSIADVKKATEKAKKRQEKERKATGKSSVSTADLDARKEAYEFGTPEATENSLSVTPGQSTDDWNKQVGVMQEKQTSMREALAKMWGVEEGHNPFKKEEEKTPKKEAKTMTGKPVTKVSIGMKEK